MVRGTVVSPAHQGSNPGGRIYSSIFGDALSVGGDVPVDDEGAYGDFVNFKMICRLSLSEVLIGVGCACVRS